MIYKFKSPAAGDVIMLGPQGDHMLQLLGREPAPRGIIESAAMPAAIAALQAAIADAEKNGTANTTDADDAGDAARPQAVGLRARLWPMIELLRRSHDAGEPVVWGV